MLPMYNWPFLPAPLINHEYLYDQGNLAEDNAQTSNYESFRQAITGSFNLSNPVGVTNLTTPANATALNILSTRATATAPTRPQPYTTVSLPGNVGWSCGLQAHGRQRAGSTPQHLRRGLLPAHDCGHPPLSGLRCERRQFQRRPVGLVQLRPVLGPGNRRLQGPEVHCRLLLGSQHDCSRRPMMMHGAVSDNAPVVIHVVGGSTHLCCCWNTCILVKQS